MSDDQDKTTMSLRVIQLHKALGVPLIIFDQWSMACFFGGKREKHMLFMYAHVP